MYEVTRTVKWKLFYHSSEAWESMLVDCEQAQVSIDLEQYIFEYDAIGRRFAELLKRKAKEGIQVRLLCDAAGSYNFYNSSWANDLAAHGVMIEFFNPISPWRVSNYSSWFFRDHRKVLVVDSHIGHIGGVGIHQRMHNWRDTHVRIEGPVVQELQYVFEQMWNRVREGKFFRFSKPFFASESRGGKPQAFTKYFYFLTNAPRFHQRFIYHSLIDAIRGARSYIYLTTPYFIPDLRLVRVLRLAARRGVDVRLIVPDTSDHPIVDLATQSYFWIMLKAKARVYLYHDHVLHAKTIIIDDEWASVGSANLDNLSLVFNYEVNLVGTNHTFVKELRDQFVVDLERSREVSLPSWKQRSRVRKIFEAITWPIHKFL
jgi:cardiolipin synthase